MQGYISMYLSIKCNQISFGPESLLKKDVWLLVSMLAPRILHFYMLRIILYSFWLEQTAYSQEADKH